jgi:Flp pilus assembly protein TadD
MAPGRPVLANNLASLLVERATEPSRIAMGVRIARRFRRARHPAFADTYGWSLVRDGRPAAAVAHLEQAARRMPESGAVLYHLGAAYAFSGRHEQAKTVFSHAEALDLAEDFRYLPLIEEAMAALAHAGRRKR